MIADDGTGTSNGEAPPCCGVCAGEAGDDPLTELFACPVCAGWRACGACWRRWLCPDGHGQEAADADNGQAADAGAVVLRRGCAACGVSPPRGWLALALGEDWLRGSLEPALLRTFETARQARLAGAERALGRLATLRDEEARLVGQLTAIRRRGTALFDRTARACAAGLARPPTGARPPAPDASDDDDDGLAAVPGAAEVGRERAGATGWTPCPRPGCDGVLPTGAGASGRGRCTRCGVAACVRCLAEVPDAADPATHRCDPAELATVAAFRARVRTCPSCLVPTLKTGGCNHTFCTLCGAEYDYRSGAEVPRRHRPLAVAVATLGANARWRDRVPAPVRGLLRCLQQLEGAALDAGTDRTGATAARTTAGSGAEAVRLERRFVSLAAVVGRGRRRVMTGSAASVLGAHWARVGRRAVVAAIVSVLSGALAELSSSSSAPAARARQEAEEQEDDDGAGGRRGNERAEPRQDDAVARDDGADDVVERAIREAMERDANRRDRRRKRARSPAAPSAAAAEGTEVLATARREVDALLDEWASVDPPTAAWARRHAFAWLRPLAVGDGHDGGVPDDYVIPERNRRRRRR